MFENLYKLYEQLTTPPTLAVVFLMLSIYCFSAAFGVSPGLQLGKFSPPAPNTTIGKIVYSGLGISFLAIFVICSVSLFPEYRATVDGKLIYAGKDARQIVSDGEDVYILKYNGNIFRITQGALELIDDGTETQQIAPAGGVIYILKDNGNIWAGQWLSGSTARYQFTKKDSGTNTKQIVSVGETLYVLKNNGQIWKYFTRPGDSGNVRDDFVIIYTGTEIKEISSSGALLYILKKDGSIWQYAPIQLKESGPCEEIYKGRDAISIKADGRALYFIKQDGSAWKYSEDSFKHIDTGSHDAKEIDAQYGLVYILTAQQTIWKYNSQNGTSREIDKANNDNERIAAYGPDIFVIKNSVRSGGVWRYNEGLIKR
jgi:hypothetical protein